MRGKNSGDNKSKVDGVDYAMAIVGTGCSIVFLLMFFTNDFSFLWSFGNHGRLGGVPGILMMVLCFVMSFYSLKKIFNTNKDE